MERGTLGLFWAWAGLSGGIALLRRCWRLLHFLQFIASGLVTHFAALVQILFGFRQILSYPSAELVFKSEVGTASANTSLTGFGVQSNRMRVVDGNSFSSSIHAAEVVASSCIAPITGFGVKRQGERVVAREA